MSRLKKTLATVLTASLLMVMMASPAFAFIHEFIPAGQCAASDQAGDNETAEEHLPRCLLQRPRRPTSAQRRRSSTLAAFQREGPGPRPFALL